MFKKFSPAPFIVLALCAVVGVLVAVVGGRPIAVLSPMGTIAKQQYDLIIIAAALCALIVVPVFGLMLGIAWRYRATNTKAVYQPDWAHSRAIELVWWGVPCAIIFVLGIVAWQSSHSLDPFKPLAAAQKPLTIQVVALQWKWLFIYPEQHIATVNYLEIPTGTPVTFDITADAPMNSFWIPQLGGQIYAMAGMSTHLHLMASAPGDYNGSSANISGTGFAGMTLVARARTMQEFASWVSAAKRSSSHLDLPAYTKLAQPSQNNAWADYTAPDPDLYNKIIMKYMTPGMAQPQPGGADHGAHH